MLPVAIGLVGTVERMRGQPALRYRTAAALVVAYAASVGGLGTPVGSPPNLIGIAMLQRLAGVRISFVEWMMIALPILMVMTAAIMVIVRVIHRPELPRLPRWTTSVPRSTTSWAGGPAASA